MQTTAVAAAVDQELPDVDVVAHADRQLDQVAALPKAAPPGHDVPASSHDVLVLAVIALAQLAWLSALGYGLLKLVT